MRKRPGGRAPEEGMSKTNTLLVIAVALALGGCDVTGSGGLDAPGMTAFAGFREGAGAPMAAATAAALGGLIGPKLGSALDDNDRRLAYQAQIDALERGAPGAPIAWRNPETGRHGNIVAGPEYEVEGATCRGYSHTVTLAGEPHTVRKTACRKADGRWGAIG
ncbi:LipA a lipoprotein [Nitrobacter sp. Nb-311A]|nr:LipA a lipoprotein [Nitrobacter sp. Nb-311A]